MLWNGDMPLWPPRSLYRDTVCEGVLADLKRRTDEEYRRLLYVAMTRAEDRLYIGGAEGKRPPPADCWLRLIRDGLVGVEQIRAYNDADLILQIRDDFARNYADVAALEEARRRSLQELVIRFTPGADGVMEGELTFRLG